MNSFAHTPFVAVFAHCLFVRSSLGEVYKNGTSWKHYSAQNLMTKDETLKEKVESREYRSAEPKFVQHRVRKPSNLLILGPTNASTVLLPQSETSKSTITSNDEGDRVAVCFFGQVKHYEQVAASQKKHVFDILQAANFSFDIFSHTYNQTDFRNPRNDVERACKIDPTSLQNNLSLPNSNVHYDSPATADQLHNIQNLARHGDPWPNNPLLSILYFTRQLYSLKQVTQLWTPATHKYRFVLYLRPDMLFLSPLDLPQNAPALNAATISTPDWHQYGGLNDRLAYGVPAAMAAYGTRGDSLKSYVDSGKMPHAETFLKHFLQSRGIATVGSRTKFQRVRADGHIDRRDVGLKG
jgi:hypothetical protein